MKQFSATITTRYNARQEDVYNEVMSIVKQHSIPKSTAQFLLVQKGVKHKDNPSPLVPPEIKVVVKKEVVYKDRPVEKIVYKDRPKEERITEHISEELVGGFDKEQRLCDDKVTTPDKAGPLLALGVNKSSNSSNVGGWIIGLGVVGVIVYGLIRTYTT